MFTYPVQPICTFSCTSVFIINIYYPQYTVLHILSHCTSYSFYFIICSLFHSHLYLYIYSLVLCFIVLLLMLFLFSILLLLLFFFCTFHWADLSWPTFHYGLYPVWLCMWQIIKNLEPWTLTFRLCPPAVFFNTSNAASIWSQIQYCEILHFKLTFFLYVFVSISASLFKSLVSHDSSEIILIYWFAAFLTNRKVIYLTL